MSFTNKVFLITGGSKGIGKAVALGAASQGASVVISYLSDARAAEAVISQIGRDRAIAVQADASNPDDIDRLVKVAVDRFGKIDVVIPNGILPLPLFYYPLDQPPFRHSRIGSLVAIANDI